MILINGLLLYKCRKAKRLHPQMNFFKKNFKLDSVQVYKCKEIFQKKGMITGLFLKHRFILRQASLYKTKDNTL